MEFSMKKFKRIRRIFAWIGIVVLVGLYVTTLILAFSGSPMAQALFRGSFAATVVSRCCSTPCRSFTGS